MSQSKLDNQGLIVKIRPMPRPQRLPLPAVRQWTTAHVSQHPKDLTRALAEAFGVTRAAAAPVVRQLEREAFVVRHGSGTRPVFNPGPSRFVQAQYALPGVDESLAWERDFAPYLALPANLGDILQYGLTQMVNNANDHSGGTQLLVSCAVAAHVLYLWVQDDGVGVFERLSSTLGLADRRLALLELSKGRVTTDPKRHSGEGIFFTSRAFSVFRLQANGLVYERRNRELDTAEDSAGPTAVLEIPARAPGTVPTAEKPRDAGSEAAMALRLNSPLVLRELFTSFTTGAPDDLTFDRTVVPVRLARLSSEALISRSQAKRLLSRVERFKVIGFDFEGVAEIGQAFADEIFRVFAAEHPHISVHALNAGPGVLPMIRRVMPR